MQDQRNRRPRQRGDEESALPFFAVRSDALIGSYLRETNARLRKLFD
jgi:hypothetical protein